MPVTIEQLLKLVKLDECEHLEFKTAKDEFKNERLLKYCCALANEGGGKVILGVTDKAPRQIVGTRAFSNIQKIKQKLISTLQLKIDAVEIMYQEARVLVFDIPSRPLGVPISYDKVYWMRRGEELVAMTQDMLKGIFNESVPDYSAQICTEARFEDLSEEGIEEFRRRWIRKSGNEKLGLLSSHQLLHDAELVDGNRITFAALALFGKHRSLGRLNFAHAEVIFEYRSKEIAGPASQREEFREGFFLYYDKLWELVNLRNDMQHFQDGLFIQDIPTFSERSIREAILNAVSHRDYQNPGNVFIKQFPEKIEITSPGGFPDGINPENILDKQMPRNRRIAETFAKCGLVERSGQGADRMFEEAIEQGKSLPDYSLGDSYQVILKLDGRVIDEYFLKFLEKASSERKHPFTTHELLVLDTIHNGGKIRPNLRYVIQVLLQDGIIERMSRNKFILSKKFYVLSGKKGVYTRKKGLDRETNKQLLLKHIRENAQTGSTMPEFRQILPECTDIMIRNLINELRTDKQIEKKGDKRGSKYFTFD